MAALLAATTLGALLAPAGPSLIRMAHAPSPRSSLATAAAAAEQQLRELATLSPGDALPFCEVTGAHGDKLFLEVPVVRDARRGATKRVDAQLNLPRAHKLRRNPKAAVGRRLTVYVRRANVDDGTLHVALRKPDPNSWGNRRRVAAEWPLKLEELELGQTVSGTVLSTHDFGCFLALEVSRAGRAGRREPLDGLLPLDQLADGVVLLELRRNVELVWPERRPGDAPATRRLAVGDAVEARVLAAQVGTGRLVLTMSDAPADELRATGVSRKSKQKRQVRRPWVGDPRLAPGSEREGAVLETSEAGAVVNVGARRPGFVPASLMRRAGVAAPTDLERGQRVLCKVQAESTPNQLLLSLVRLFGEGYDAQSDALRRRGERRGRYRRVEDEATGVLPPPPRPPRSLREKAEAAAAAAAGAAQADEEEDDDDDDDVSWAAAAAAAPPSTPPEEEEDPFAWAAAGAAGEEEDDGNSAAAEDVDIDDDYLEDKYGDY